MSLRQFVLELHGKQRLSQTEIGKRSGLSQGLIYKILAGLGTPQMRTYQKLASAFPDEWNDYLRRHPSFRKELREAFGWATAFDEANRVRGDDPLELFESLLGVDRSGEFPADALERYRTKIRDVMRRAARDLEEYRKCLEDELRSGRRSRRKK